MRGHGSDLAVSGALIGTIGEHRNRRSNVLRRWFRRAQCNESAADAQRLHGNPLERCGGCRGRAVVLAGLLALIGVPGADAVGGNTGDSSTSGEASGANVPEPGAQTFLKSAGFELRMRDGEEFCSYLALHVVSTGPSVVDAHRDDLSADARRFIGTVRGYVLDECGKTRNTERRDILVWHDDGYPVYSQEFYRLWTDEPRHEDSVGELDSHIMTLDASLSIVASGHRNHSTIRTLLEKGAQVQGGNYQGEGPPMCRLGSSSYATIASAETVELFLKAGATPPWRCRETGTGHSPLIWAAGSGTPEHIQLLVDAGADPNFEIPRGTPLEIAAEHNSDPKVLQALLDAGAAPTDKVISLARERFDGSGIVASLERDSGGRRTELLERCRELAAPPPLDGSPGGTAVSEIKVDEAISACNSAITVDDTNLLGPQVNDTISASEFYADRARYAALNVHNAQYGDLVAIQDCEAPKDDNEGDREIESWRSDEAAFFYARMWYEPGVRQAGEDNIVRRNPCFHWAVDTIERVASGQGAARAERFIGERSSEIPSGWVRLSETERSFCEYYDEDFGGCSASGRDVATGNLICLVDDDLDFDVQPQVRDLSIPCRTQEKFDGGYRVLIPADEE